MRKSESRGFFERKEEKDDGKKGEKRRKREEEEEKKEKSLNPELLSARGEKEERNFCFT